MYDLQILIINQLTYSSQHLKKPNQLLPKSPIPITFHLQQMLRLITKNLSQKVSHRLLTHLPHQPYHMSYIMDSKHDDKFVKIDRRAFHLYKDFILKVNRDKFNQKLFILIIIDSVRTKQKYEDFEQLVEYGASKLGEFTEVLSIFAFATQLYLYNYANREISYKLAQKAFQLMQECPPLNMSSFYVMKLLIFIQKCVGLEKFPNQTYALIDYRRFKALFLCFTLEMFYKNNLQHYGVVQHVLEVFTENENIIPFADLHHYNMACKIIKSETFKKFVEKLENLVVSSQNGGYVKTDIPELPEDEEILSDQILLVEGEDRKPQTREKRQKKTIMEEPPRNLNQATKSSIQFPWHQAFAKDIQKRYTYFP